MIKSAFAKINLFLNIVGRNDQQYHLLQSLFIPLQGLHDIITFSQAQVYQLKVKGLDIDSENIITRTVRYLEKYTGHRFDVRITLEKNIPIAAGLGGGSSNAAHTLLALNQMYGLDLSMQELMDIAMQIGADVPFFLQQSAALVSGIGEQILPVQLNQTLYILLLKPQIAISTQKVYQKSVSAFTDKLNIGSNLKEQLLENIFNGNNALEQPAFSLYPEVEEIKQLIKQQKGNLVARLSGSGSTCFGLFANEQLLVEAYDNIEQIYPNLWKHKEVVQI